MAITELIDEMKSKAKDYADIPAAAVLRLTDCDIYKNYRWGMNIPSQEFITDVPVISLQEFQSNTGPILEDLQYNLALAKAGSEAVQNQKPDPYTKIYNGVPTGNLYRLPFFSTYNHTMNNSWEVADQSDIFAKVRGALQTGLSIFQKGSIEKRRRWSGSTPASYQFDFLLYNTFNIDDIPKNFNFIRTLTHNNLPTRTTFATMLPPCFYRLEIPGVRYAPVAVLEGVNIENVGQVNRKKIMVPNSSGTLENIWMNIPDAWQVTISVSELHSETREIYDSTFNTKAGSKVSVISQEDAIEGESITTKVNPVGRFK